MHFNLAVVGIILAGAAFEAPVQDVFESNREKILAETTSVVGDYVFSVGRVKQTIKAGDDIGYSKAATIAYANLDLLNYNRAPWPVSVDNDEKKAAWMIYRSKHPFQLTVEGGQRVYSKRTGGDKYLVVMAFPRNVVFADSPRLDVLKAAITQYRNELKKAEEEAMKLATERAATNSPTIIAPPPIKGNSPINGAITIPLKDEYNSIKKNENFDVDLML